MSLTTGLIYAGVTATIATACLHWPPFFPETPQRYFVDVLWPSGTMEFPEAITSLRPPGHEWYYPVSMSEFPSAIQCIASELVEYREFDQNWSGEGSVAPSVDSINEALAFLDTFPAALELPSPTLSADGEVGFYWTSSKGYIDFRFEGLSRATLYLRNRLTGVDYFYDEVNWRNMTREYYEEILGFLVSGERSVA